MTPGPAHVDPRPPGKSNAVDSSAVAEQVAAGGTLKFYLRTLLTNPGKIGRGVLDSLGEISRFVVHPRFPVTLTALDRMRLVGRWIVCELKIPGGTTVLETIWLAYAASLAETESASWVEVGCFKGLSTARMSLLCRHWRRRLYVCDTFEGLPDSDDAYEAVDKGPSYHFKRGSYAGSEEEVLRNVANHGCVDRVTLVRGDVGETLPNNDFGTVGFAFLDVDLVDSYKACFSGLAANIEAGSVIAIHEACYSPIRRLIEDREFWSGLDLAAPRITYVADRFRLPSCRNLAILRW